MSLLAKTPFEHIKPGMGWSPSSGPPVGGQGMMPMSTFYGDNVNALLPDKRVKWNYGRRTKVSLNERTKVKSKKSSNKGRKKLMKLPKSMNCKFGERTNVSSKRTNVSSKRTNMSSKRTREFGNRAYPVTNQPNPTISDTFPLPPTGSGRSPGGTGGSVWLPQMPNFQQFWGFGRRMSKNKRRKSRVSRRRPRLSKRKSMARTRRNKRKSY